MLGPIPLHRMLAALAADKVDPYDGGWHFTLTPDVWLQNINSKINGHVPGSNLGDFSVSTEIGPYDYLRNLQFGAMATGEVRKGDWSVFTDIIGMPLTPVSFAGARRRAWRRAVNY